MNLADSLRERRPVIIAIGALAPLVLCAALYTVRDSITSATAALAIVLVVVAVAATGDSVSGLVAALSGGVWFDFFLTEPYLTFEIRDPDDIEVTVLLVLIGAAVSEVALWGRRQQERASLRAGYLDGVLRTAGAISLHHEPPAALADDVAGQIASVLGISRCRFVTGPVHDPRYAVLERDGTVRRRDHVVNVDRDGMPSDEETVLPVMSGDRTLGYFVLTAAADIARPSAEQRRVAVLLADQIAVALAHG